MGWFKRMIGAEDSRTERVGDSLPVLPEGYFWRIDADGTFSFIDVDIYQKMTRNREQLVASGYVRKSTEPARVKRAIVDEAHKVYNKWQRDRAMTRVANDLSGDYPPRRLDA